MKTLLITIFLFVCVTAKAQSLIVSLKPGMVYSRDSTLFTNSKPDSLDNNFQIDGLFTKKYLIAIYKNQLAFIRYDDIEPTSKFLKFWDKYYVKPGLKRSKEDFETRMKPYFDKYGRRFGNSVFLHEVVIGMNAKTVKASIGDPTRVTHTETQYGSSEVWVYPYDNYRDKYVFFTNGLVSGWDTPIK